MRSKKLDGQFLRDMDKKAGRSWLRKGYLKKETEGFLVAAQSQGLRLNAIKAKIAQSQESLLCRLSHQKSDTVKHILSAWPKMAQTQ